MWIWDGEYQFPFDHVRMFPPLVWTIKPCFPGFTESSFHGTGVILCFDTVFHPHHIIDGIIIDGGYREPSFEPDNDPAFDDVNQVLPAFFQCWTGCPDPGSSGTSP